MSLKDVEKKVMASAREEARQLVEQAEAETKTELERRAAALREDHQRKTTLGRAEVEQQGEREINSRRAEHNMKLLEAKNGAIEAVFRIARERILASDGFDYGAWLAAQVRLAAQKASGTLYCAERDRATVEAVLRESGAHGVALAPEPGMMAGGVFLVGEGADLDLTLEAALADLREELLVPMADKLFADVPPISVATEGAGE